MKYFLLFVASLVISANINFSLSQVDILKYENEIDNILASMSLEEKVGQTCQITLDAILKKDSLGQQLFPLKIDHYKLSEAFENYHVGSVLNVGWCTLSREEWSYIHDEINRFYRERKTSIPVLYGIDAIHGNNYTKGSTLFPQEIGLAATWDRELVHRFAQISAYETRASGIPWNFSPVLDIGRQPLWSRHFETLGEDPYLVSELGVQLVEGYQGQGNQIDQFHVAACLKHFVGYSGTKSGRDRTPAWIPKRYMSDLFLPPFEKAVKAGALTIMVNSGDVNGVPGHANAQLLDSLLKREWGFKGFTVSDWEDFIMLHTVHSVSPNLEEAYVKAFNAGVDMSMVPLSPQYKHYCESIITAVQNGLISHERLDDAVRRILRVKFALNLFSEPSFDQDYPKFNEEKSKSFSKQAATESITLLENDGILPLNKSDKLLLVGPTSDDLIYLNGAWTHTWQGDNNGFNTDGRLSIRDFFSQQLAGNFDFCKGAELFKENHFERTRLTDTSEYTAKLNEADVVIVCLGEYPSTEKPGDIRSLNLDNEQQELVRIAARHKKPVVLVLLEGRPRIIREIVPMCSAVIQCYLPGDFGAEALFDLVYGNKNFSGKLPYTYPKYDGIIEFYDHPKSVARDNNGGFDAFDPQWDFGHGLSYTEFDYSDIEISNDTLVQGGTISVNFSVHNSGDVAGKETVMLYISDCFASSVPHGKRLKRFEKIYLTPGESKNITFSISEKDLYFIDSNGAEKLESGLFKITLNSKESEFNLILEDDK
jgi:beta-glucosidase